MAEAAAAQARGGRRSSQETADAPASSSGFSLGFASKILGGSGSLFSRSSNSQPPSSPASPAPAPAPAAAESTSPRAGSSVGGLFSGFGKKKA